MSYDLYGLMCCVECVCLRFQHDTRSIPELHVVDLASKHVVLLGSACIVSDIMLLRILIRNIRLR